MAVPTYTRIDPTEVDSESPIPASLAYRWAYNVLALLGIDIADTNPSVGLGFRGEIFATRSSVTSVNATVTGSAPGPYTWVVPTGVTKLLLEGMGGGGGGGDGLSPDTGVNGTFGVYEYQRLVAVVPGETITITPGAGGVGALNSAGTNGGASTVVGSISGTLLSCPGGNGGPRYTPTSVVASSARGRPGIRGEDGLLNDVPVYSECGTGDGAAGLGVGSPGLGSTGTGGAGAGGCVRIAF